MGKVYVVRTVDDKRQSYGRFQWPEYGEVAAPDWNPEPHCGNGLHGLLNGIGDYSLLRLDDPKAVWQVVEVDEATLVDLGNKVKYPRGSVVYSGNIVGAQQLIAEKRLLYLAAKHGDAHAEQAPASTSGEQAPASTSGEQAPASTSGEQAPASTSGEQAPASTSGNYAPASTSGNYAPASTSGNYAPASTSGHYAPASTSGNYAPASTSGHKAPASTSGNYAPASTSGNYAPASTSGEQAPASTSGNYAPASTSGNYAPASTSGHKAPASTSGNYAPASTSGEHSTACCLGVGGVAKAGVNGAVILTWWDGQRYRHVVGYVGEDGITADTWYTVNNGKLVEAPSPF